jgi:DNA-directed RNA polymerase subunit RPC12/RpoP
MYEEIEDSRKALCEMCRKFVSVTEIKYLPKGDNSRMALCTSCLKIFNTGKDDKKKKTAQSASMSGGKTYFCGRCRYKFKFNLAGNAELRCPYCGKKDKILENKDIDADSIIRTAEY